MKISDKTRLDMFNSGRDLSSELGNIFKDKTDITPEDLNREISLVYQAKRREIARFQRYIEALGMMLCFPEKLPAK